METTSNTITAAQATDLIEKLIDAGTIVTLPLGACGTGLRNVSATCEWGESEASLDITVWDEDADDAVELGSFRLVVEAVSE